MFVSVIIPVYNAENKIIELLNGLNHQKYSGNFEVILVDDDSTDNSKAVIQAYISKNTSKFNITLVEIEHQGPAVARNIGQKNLMGIS